MAHSAYPGRLAQMVRALASHARGPRFESWIAHHRSGGLRVHVNPPFANRCAEVAERKTRYVQGVVSLRMCGFKSLLRHQVISTCRQEFHFKRL